jgi:hypothetical protein
MYEQTLLIWEDAAMKQSILIVHQLTTGRSLKNAPFPILNLRLDTKNGVRRLHLERNCLPSQCLHKYLHCNGEGSMMER